MTKAQQWAACPSPAQDRIVGMLLKACLFGAGTRRTADSCTCTVCSPNASGLREAPRPRPADRGEITCRTEGVTMMSRLHDDAGVSGHLFKNLPFSIPCLPQRSAYITPAAACAGSCSTNHLQNLRDLQEPDGQVSGSFGSFILRLPDAKSCHGDRQSPLQVRLVRRQIHS